MYAPMSRYSALGSREDTIADMMRVVMIDL